MPQKFVIFFSLGSSYHENLGQISAQFETIKNSYKPSSLIFVPVDTGHWRTNVVHKIYEAMKKGSTKVSLEDALSNPEKREDVFRSAYKEEYEAGVQWRNAFKEPIEEQARIHFGSSIPIEFQNWYDLDPEYDRKMLRSVSDDFLASKASEFNEAIHGAPWVDHKISHIQVVMKLIYHKTMADFLSYRIKELTEKLLVASPEDNALYQIIKAEFEERFTKNSFDLAELNELISHQYPIFEGMINDYPQMSDDQVAMFSEKIDYESKGYNTRRDSRLQSYDIYSSELLTRWVIRLSIEYVLKCYSAIVAQSLVSGVHYMYYPRKTGVVIKYLTDHMLERLYAVYPLRIEDWQPLRLISITNYKTISSEGLRKLNDAVFHLLRQYMDMVVGYEDSRDIVLFCKDHHYDKEQITEILSFWTQISPKTSIKVEQDIMMVTLDDNEKDIRECMKLVMLMILNLMNKRSGDLDRAILLMIVNQVVEQFNSLIDALTKTRKAVDDLSEPSDVSKFSLFLERLDLESEYTQKFQDTIQYIDDTNKGKPSR